MYLSPDDARSDVILAAATTLFGGFVISLMSSLPFYPRRGVLPVVLGVVWAFALTGLVPWLLARHRGDGRAAFGLDVPRGAWTGGLVLAAPVAALAVVRQLLLGDSPLTALLGRASGAAFASPVVGELGGGQRTVAVAAAVALFVSLTAGALLLTTFLTVRGREAFRSPDVSLTELLRTFGMGAVVAALVLGLARSIGESRLLPVVLQVVALAGVVLLADRLVPHGRTTSRAAVLTPVVVTVVAHVFAFGGIFRGDLLAGLHTGALAAGVVTVVAALVETRAKAWSAVPLLVALHWWPSCLSPLALELGPAVC